MSGKKDSGIDSADDVLFDSDFIEEIMKRTGQNNGPDSYGNDNNDDTNYISIDDVDDVMSLFGDINDSDDDNNGTDVPSILDHVQENGERRNDNDDKRDDAIVNGKIKREPIEETDRTTVTVESQSEHDIPDDHIDDSEQDFDVEVNAPDWVVSLRGKLISSVAHSFLLHGNVRDYMVRNISIIDGIVSVLDPSYDNFDIIARYDQAHGVYFYGNDIRQKGTILSDVYEKRFVEQIKKTKTFSNREYSNDPVLLFAAISELFDMPSDRVLDDGSSAARILLFIDHSDLLVPDASSAQMKPDERKLAITLSDIGRSQKADEAGNCMVFITDDITQLSSRIRSTDSRIEQIKIPIPDQEEREDFIDNVLDIPSNTLSDGTQVFAHPESIDTKTFAINSAGLSRIQIEDIMLRALAEDEPLTMRLMKDRKNEIIKEDYDDVLEIVDPKFGFERIGGLENVKRLFKEEVIDPIHTGDKEAVPMGILLMSPPGTSKRVNMKQPIVLMKRISHTNVNQPQWYTVGDIEPGDYVAGFDGKFYLVDGVVPMPDSEIYEIELKDGRIVESSGDHPFQVLAKAHKKWTERIMTPQEMIEKGIHITGLADKKRGYSEMNRAKFQMQTCDAVDMPEKELEVPPYVLGAFLGDGCHNESDALELSSNDNVLVEHVAELLNCYCHKQKGDTYSWNFYKSPYDSETNNNKRVHSSDITTKYQDLLTRTYAIDKYIPDEYKLSSIEQRLEIIRGMMDTDGCITLSGGRYNVSFSSTSERLCRDFMEIIYSLGWTCSIDKSNQKGKVITSSEERLGKEYYHKHDLYEVHVNVPNDAKESLFWLPRKRSIAHEAKSVPDKRKNYSRIPIADVRATGRIGHMRCIHCTAPDHLFLIGDYVPTHNTMMSKAVAHESNMNFVSLNLNRIMDKWVGSSERNLDRALDCAMAMAPTIIFIDEIDEALPNRNAMEQSSVNKRINQRLLTFFSETEHRGDVMILAATNYPSKIDPAFKRAGRFDIRIPMFAPDGFDRIRIMNVIARSRGYTFSVPGSPDGTLEDPDKMVHNPFRGLRAWLEDGNVPVNEGFVGEHVQYQFKVKDAIGNVTKHEIYIPKCLRDIIGRDEIRLEELYKNITVLFEDMRTRTSDSSTGEVESDESYFKYIHSYLESNASVIGGDPLDLEDLYKRIVLWESVYSTFLEQTNMMTGAELDVVMNKAITLWKRWMRAIPRKKFEDGIKKGLYRDDHDIPWKPFLYDACHRTVSASAGIKKMEDDALINTSDTDFIPDMLYAKTDDGREISYKERHEELIMNEVRSTIG